MKSKEHKIISKINQQNNKQGQMKITVPVAVKKIMQLKKEDLFSWENLTSESVVLKKEERD